MKWQKFLHMQQKHPFIMNVFDSQGNLEDVKDFVRKKVGYIAFHPFEKLDLSSRGQTISAPVESSDAQSEASHFKTVEYQMYFHAPIESGGSGSRLVTHNVGNGSIQAHIDDVMKWVESSDQFRYEQLVWDYVVRRTSRGSTRVGLTNIDIEIFLFPRLYRARQIQRKPSKPLPDPFREWCHPNRTLS